jgi:hypothetical protein
MSDAMERPLGVSLLTWFFWFWAGASFLVLVVILVGDGPIPLSGTAVPRDEAVARLLPVLVPMGLATLGAGLALALGKHWARSAVLLPFALAAVAPAFSGAVGSLLELALGALALVPVVALLVWYLYFRPNVRSYFARLRQEEGRGQPTRPTPPERY